MLRSLTQLYCLIICLISSITIMITLGIAFSNITDIALTEYKYASSFNKFSSNDKYIEHKIQHSPDNKEMWNTLSEEEIRTKRNIEKEDYLNKQKNEALSTLINCLTWLFVAGLFFTVHWRLQKKYSLQN